VCRALAAAWCKPEPVELGACCFLFQCHSSEMTRSHGMLWCTLCLSNWLSMLASNQTTTRLVIPRLTWPLEVLWPRSSMLPVRVVCWKALLCFGRHGTAARWWLALTCLWCAFPFSMSLAAPPSPPERVLVVPHGDRCAVVVRRPNLSLAPAGTALETRFRCTHLEVQAGPRLTKTWFSEQLALPLDAAAGADGGAVGVETGGDPVDLSTASTTPPSMTMVGGIARFFVTLSAPGKHAAVSSEFVAVPLPWVLGQGHCEHEMRVRVRRRNANGWGDWAAVSSHVVVAGSDELATMPEVVSILSALRTE